MLQDKVQNAANKNYQSNNNISYYLLHKSVTTTTLQEMCIWKMYVLNKARAEMHFHLIFECYDVESVSLYRKTLK